MRTQTSATTTVGNKVYGLGEDANSQALFRRLVNRVMTPNRSSARLEKGTDYEDVIIDTEIDGARYILVRLPKSARPSVRLSPREQEIVRMVAQGDPNKIIAGKLNISFWTVCTHLRRVFAKLGVGTRAAMVARLSRAVLNQSDPRT